MTIHKPSPGFPGSCEMPQQNWGLISLSRFDVNNTNKKNTQAKFRYRWFRRKRFVNYKLKEKDIKPGDK